MGSKQTWKREHLFLYLTCGLILIFVFAGCANFGYVYLNQQSHDKNYLAKAANLMQKGDYKASVAEIQRIMKLYPGSLKDDGLFMMGLVYMHPENPERDYNKSLECFTTLEANGEFVKNNIKTESLIYRILLEERLDSNKEIKELKHKIKFLETNINKQKKNTANLQNQQKKVAATTKKLQDQIKGLKKQIKNLKEIDLGIEEKKRKSLDKNTGTP